MPDDKSKTGTADRVQIDTHQLYELTYWSEKLGVTKQKIIQAVDAAGPRVENVRRYLGR
jgi:hypothetical protein